MNKEYIVKLENYGLKIKNNILFENVNVLFANRMINIGVQGVQTR